MLTRPDLLLRCESRWETLYSAVFFFLHTVVLASTSCCGRLFPLHYFPLEKNLREFPIRASWGWSNSKKSCKMWDFCSCFFILYVPVLRESAASGYLARAEVVSVTSWYDECMLECVLSLVLRGRWMCKERWNKKCSLFFLEQKLLTAGSFVQPSISVVPMKRSKMQIIEGVQLIKILKGVDF